jgi:FtsZ-interacting cell division protein ZipA
MNIIKKLLILVAISALVSVNLVGCTKKDEKSAIEHPTKEKASDEHPTDEHPTKEKASDEHPTDEHPTKEKASDEHPPGNE